MKNSQQALSLGYGTGAALHFFWILNVFKEAYPGVKSFLNFYPPVGPLLGLFIFSFVFGCVVHYILRTLKFGDQKSMYYFVLVSSLVFSFMVFPLFFEPVVQVLR